MTTRDETIPPESVIAAAVEQLLFPALKRLSEDVAHTFIAMVAVMQGTSEMRHLRLKNEVAGTSPIEGKIRLRFRSTFKPNRYLVHAESIFDKPRSSEGFSGFNLKGEIMTGQECTTKRTSWTVRYNVWDWSG